jgi:hypothetical protein
MGCQVCCSFSVCVTIYNASCISEIPWSRSMSHVYWSTNICLLSPLVRSDCWLFWTKTFKFADSSDAIKIALAEGKIASLLGVEGCVRISLLLTNLWTTDFQWPSVGKLNCCPTVVSRLGYSLRDFDACMPQCLCGFMWHGTWKETFAWRYQVIKRHNSGSLPYSWMVFCCVVSLVVCWSTKWIVWACLWTCCILQMPQRLRL